MAEPKIYGYSRVSTKHQKLDRQIANIKEAYPGAIIYSEAFTGASLDRPIWKRLRKQLRENDTVVFDEVSRMSRDAEEGFKEYKELYDMGVNLVFLKESALNTENFRNVSQIAMTGNDVDIVLEAINKYMMILAENQIKAAFTTAEHELTFNHKRTSEGVRRAQASGKQVGIAKGTKLETKKSKAAKEKILKLSIDFYGNLKDKEVIELVRIARNTYYKYKRELSQIYKSGN